MVRMIGASVLVACALSAPMEQARAQEAVGGAVMGAVTGAFIGGMINGRPDRVIAGAIVGGTAGAILGSESPGRPGYFWADGDCFRRVPGRAVQVSRRYCY